MVPLLMQPVVGVDMAIHLADEVSELAAASGVKLPAYDAARKHLDKVKAHAGAKGDIAGIYGALRQDSGLAYENQK